MHASFCTVQKRIKAAKTWKITWQDNWIILSHRKILSWGFYFRFLTHWTAKSTALEKTGISLAYINVKVSQACESYMFWHFGLKVLCLEITTGLNTFLKAFTVISILIVLFLHYIPSLFFLLPFFFLLNINSVQLHHLHPVTPVTPPPPLSLSHPKLGQHSSRPGDPAGPVWKREYYKLCTVFCFCFYWVWLEWKLWYCFHINTVHITGPTTTV